MNALSCTETNTQIHIRKKYHPLREDGILFQIFKNQILWITKPERSFGSNQVVFGRHDITGIGNIQQLFHRNRIQSESHFHLPAVYAFFQFT